MTAPEQTAPAKPTPAEDVAAQCMYLDDLHGELCTDMRDLSPDELYKRIERFNTELLYALDYIRKAVERASK